MSYNVHSVGRVCSLGGLTLPLGKDGGNELVKNKNFHLLPGESERKSLCRISVSKPASFSDGLSAVSQFWFDERIPSQKHR